MKTVQSILTAVLLMLTTQVYAIDTNIPNFGSPEQCKDYITATILLDQDVQDSLDYSAYFWKTSQTNPTRHTACTNGDCVTKLFFTGKDYPGAGGCQLAGTVFWSDIKSELEEELTIINAKGESLPEVTYGVVCPGKTFSDNLSGCKLEKSTN